LSVSGWDWFVEPKPPETPDLRIERAFESVFDGPDGGFVLAHLKRLFIERRFAPTASDAELRHAEGARAVVALIERLARPRAAQPNETIDGTGR